MSISFWSRNKLPKEPLYTHIYWNTTLFVRLSSQWVIWFEGLVSLIRQRNENSWKNESKFWEPAFRLSATYWSSPSRSISAHVCPGPGPSWTVCSTTSWTGYTTGPTGSASSSAGTDVAKDYWLLEQCLDCRKSGWVCELLFFFPQIVARIIYHLFIRKIVY